MRRFVLLVAASLAFTAAAFLTPPLPAANSVPAPESVLGFVPGEDRKLATWGQVLGYLKALDAASYRISVEEVGRTTLGRPFDVMNSAFLQWWGDWGCKPATAMQQEVARPGICPA